MCKKLYLLTLFLLFTLVRASPPSCFHSEDKNSCLTNRPCQWCSYSENCQTDPCQTPRPPPPLTGTFYSSTTYQVMELKPENKTSVRCTNLNKSWTPTTMTVTQPKVAGEEIQVSIKLSDETLQRQGGIFQVGSETDIFWQSILPGYLTDTWKSGSLPPATIDFPVQFNQHKFYKTEPTLQGYDIIAVTTKGTNYLIRSLNKSFDDTVAVTQGNSGTRELVSVFFDKFGIFQKNITLTGSLQCDDMAPPTNRTCQSPIFVLHNGMGAETVYKEGVAPPPAPPIPITECNAAFNQTVCHNGVERKTCKWCVSKPEGIDALCFNVEHLPSVKEWTCG